jgi:hypothetical protein
MAARNRQRLRMGIATPACSGSIRPPNLVRHTAICHLGNRERQMPVRNEGGDQDGRHSSRLSHSSPLPHYLLKPLSNTRTKAIKRQLVQHAPNELVVGPQ